PDEPSWAPAPAVSTSCSGGDSHPLVAGGPRAPGVAGVDGRLRLEQDHLHLVGQREGAVLDAARDDDELAGAEGAVAVAELHPQAALHHEEQLVLALVAVPDELALQANYLHVHLVDLAHDPRRPELGDARELLAQVDDVHRRAPQRPRRASSNAAKG